MANSFNVIFPQTVWTTPSLGFAGICRLEEMLVASGVTLSVTREYQAVVFAIKGATPEQLQILCDALPDNCIVPALVNGQRALIGNQGIAQCATEDAEFTRLMRDAHMEVTTDTTAAASAPTSVTTDAVDFMCSAFQKLEGLLDPLPEFSLEHLSRTYTDRDDGHRIASSLVDIKTAWWAIAYEMQQASRHDVKGGPPSRALFYDEDTVTAARRFRHYVYITAVIPRIRAIWDKLIILAVLLERPVDLDKALGSKRVRRYFLKHFQGAVNPISRVVWDYLHSLQPFENRFRTPELHKTGRAISWATQESMGEEMNRLLAHCNDLNRALRRIATLLANPGGQEP
jgi:hypothetical protein